MKVVPSVPFGAKPCVLTGRNRDPEGFIQQNSPVLGHLVHISAAAVKVAGNEFGMVPKQDAIDLRFRLHELEKENAELEQRVRDQELLESELADARETIAERDDILALLNTLADQGLTTKQIKGVLDRFARLKEDLAGAEDTVADLLDAVNRLAALKDGRKKVLA